MWWFWDQNLRWDGEGWIHPRLYEFSRREWWASYVMGTAMVVVIPIMVGYFIYSFCVRFILGPKEQVLLQK